MASHRSTTDRRIPSAVRAFVVLAALTLSGCAGAPASRFTEDPGVPVRVELTRGGTLHGELVGYERGALIVDHALPKSEHLEVVRREGTDIVYVSGVAIGTAVEIRDFDVVVRERLMSSEVDDTRVKTSAYLGWGSAVAAALAFLLVKLLEDV
jgi:hypothetical protein